jgi:hypothetical protein
MLPRSPRRHDAQWLRKNLQFQILSRALAISAFRAQLVGGGHETTACTLMLLIDCATASGGDCSGFPHFRVIVLIKLATLSKSYADLWKHAQRSERLCKLWFIDPKP